MKILAAIVTIVLLIAAALVFMFFLMVGLNGFNSEDGGTAMGFYALWLLVCSIAMAVASFLLTRFFLMKSWSARKSVLAAVAITVVLGLVIETAGFITSLFVASYVREKRIEQRKKENLKKNEQNNY